MLGSGNDSDPPILLEIDLYFTRFKSYCYMNKLFTFP